MSIEHAGKKLVVASFNTVTNGKPFGAVLCTVYGELSADH